MQMFLVAYELLSIYLLYINHIYASSKKDGGRGSFKKENKDLEEGVPPPQIGYMYFMSDQSTQSALHLLF